MKSECVYIKNSLSFVLLNKLSPTDFSFVSGGLPSPFARCFAIFTLKITGNLHLLECYDSISTAIFNDLKNYYKQRLKYSNSLIFDKAYLQLLCFSLSALYCLNTIHKFKIEELFPKLNDFSVTNYLNRIGAGAGKPGSGNLSMFYCILLIHTKEYLSHDTSKKIEEWCDYHLHHINDFGFWGNNTKRKYLHFQNGYHQYEIFNYLKVNNPFLKEAVETVLSFADVRGRFAPYPGGGGCYDYDAVNLITSSNTDFISKNRNLLIKTHSSILEDQNNDCGFCESRFVRPRNFKNLAAFVIHVLYSPKHARIERFRYALSLQRFKHNRVNGAEHWSPDGYRRKWDESNLWDTFFRLSTIARIEVALKMCDADKWCFFRYPGIGYHEQYR